MADLFHPPAIPPPPQRRGAARLSVNGKPIGRPPGATGKRSVDLARYIEATFAGSTPGQQAAQLAMVSPKDLREAKAAAKELGIVGVGLPPFELAMVVKTVRLAKALMCDRRDAWLMLQKEREALMGYIHQKQPAAAPKDAQQLPTMFVVAEGDMAATLAGAAAEGGDAEIIEGFLAGEGQVGQAKSDDAA